MNVKLLVNMPDGQRKEIPLSSGRYVIGRKTDAALRVPLASVSREHAELVVEKSKISIRDLGSSNGTFKNNIRVQSTDLAAGDILGIGPSCRFVVEIDGKSGVAASSGGGGGAKHLAETPPAGFPAAEDEIGDLDETVTKPAPKAPSTKRGDESSIFDFDFDFEDDENPKL
ncbi:MAG TPA: FHA domain-containing protein [Phycisphaerales bacterium]|nr:FHA domain-containing protein [Phycisphaerales bacterium]